LSLTQRLGKMGRFEIGSGISALIAYGKLSYFMLSFKNNRIENLDWSR